MNRWKIIEEVNNRILKEIDNFDNLLCGEKEQIQDKYIDIICKEKGYETSNFYAMNGEMLNELLNI